MFENFKVSVFKYTKFYIHQIFFRNRLSGIALQFFNFRVITTIYTRRGLVAYVMKKVGDRGNSGYFYFETFHTS